MQKYRMVKVAVAGIEPPNCKNKHDWESDGDDDRWEPELTKENTVPSF